MLLERIELEADEEVLLTIRKHWFVILSELLGPVLMVLFPLISVNVMMHTSYIPTPLALLVDYLPLASFVILVWILFGLLTSFMIWTHYYLDLWLVTDRRIVVIDQVHFFNRKVSSFRLERLQDVKASINGIIPTFLNFGTLHAHTAGNTEENFTSTGLPDPRGLQAAVQKATDRRLKRLTQAAVLVD